MAVWRSCALHDYPRRSRRTGRWQPRADQKGIQRVFSWTICFAVGCGYLERLGTLLLDNSGRTLPPATSRRPS
ncbi:MAG: hypothetical protein K0R44_123 [Thermomicrobiales bacterium]|nr:hypothetical protein [Thermomicrobiales bacterium]MDF3014898.1 hypothetical protein [Thermomicrobiales bacterium]